MRDPARQQMGGPSNPALARKLGIRPGDAVALLSAPSGWTIGGLREPTSVRRRAAGALDVIVAFFERRATVERRLPALLRVLRADGSLWIAWPRRAAGHSSDIDGDGLRALILPTGLVDTKVAALDEHWSALRFVWRTELRSRAAYPPRSVTPSHSPVPRSSRPGPGAPNYSR